MNKADKFKICPNTEQKIALAKKKLWLLQLVWELFPEFILTF
ncbi:hypothetical protein MYAER_4079 [Microcystis aeruginosa NIES-2549]|uniref:Uncharacterized protein n=1 Tax=Microcystis aeruginosa NIES-2549 TaxID=1641812 RepID=A0A0F6RNH9_MICAE|nr:hypothetical protein MYAER_4079 [Microcystis aeruginosa NIES-2549]AOC54812.1 hypothetical protein amyaer_4125 [Microcystis aeruginosa NIES-2481]